MKNKNWSFLSLSLLERRRMKERKKYLYPLAMAIGVARLLTGYIHLAPARPGAAADAVYPSC